MKWIIAFFMLFSPVVSAKEIEKTIEVPGVTMPEWFCNASYNSCYNVKEKKTIDIKKIHTFCVEIALTMWEDHQENTAFLNGKGDQENIAFLNGKEYQKNTAFLNGKGDQENTAFLNGKEYQENTAFLNGKKDRKSFVQGFFDELFLWMADVEE